MELLQMKATELSEKIKRGELGVEEVVNFYRERIRKTEPEIHAFLTLNDAALAERTAEVQEGIKSGRYQGKLAGVPIAVKDNICTKGLRTSCASKMLENFVPAYDATVAERLNAAGMIVIGKTNMDEFAMGSTTETSAFALTKNPRNQSHVPGGSSGGSCAAVAAGEVPLSLGSDTGGSIRQPAAYCGVTGLKPTYGSVSRYGIVAYASSMDQVGPIAGNVSDCAALYEVLAGNDPKDGTMTRKERKLSLPEFSDAAEAAEAVKGVRIGLPKEYLGEGTTDEVKEAVRQAAALLERNGAAVEEISLPLTEYVVSAYYIIACAEASSNLSRFDGVKYGYRAEDAEGLHAMYRKSRSEGFGEEAKRRILLGSFVLSAGYYDAYYLKALKVKRLIKEEFEKVFASYDCILSPTTPTTAPKFGKSLGNPLQMYLGDVDTAAVNLAGLPAISVPCGFDKKGLPIGIQFIGDWFGEEKLLCTAAAYEKLRGVFPAAWEKERGESAGMRESKAVLETGRKEGAEWNK